MDEQLKEHSTNFEELMKMMQEMMITNRSTVVSIDTVAINFAASPRTDVTSGAESLRSIYKSRFDATNGYVPKLEIPKFDGVNPRLWLRQCNQYFRVYNIPEDQKMEVASLYMVGEPKEWMSSYMSIMKGADWTDVICCLVSKYRDKIGLDIEDKEFKKWEDSFENYIVECEGFLKKGMEPEEKRVVDVVIDKKADQDDVIRDDLDNFLESYCYKEEIKVLAEKCIEALNICVGGAERGKMDVNNDMHVSVSSDLLSKSCLREEPYEIVKSSESVDIAVLYGAVLQSAVTDNEDQLCQTYQVPQSSVFKMYEKYDSLDDARCVFDCTYVRDVAFIIEHKYLNNLYSLVKGLGESNVRSENEWKIKPLPWRDKNDVVCWKSRRMDKNSVQSVAGAYGKVTLARMMHHYNGFSKGFGSIKLFTVEDARIALDPLNGKEMHFQGLRQGLREFTNEGNLLLKVQHQNLVMLQGCCVESENGWTAKPPPWRDKIKAQLHSVAIGIWSGAIRNVLVRQQEHMPKRFRSRVQANFQGLANLVKQPYLRASTFDHCDSTDTLNSELGYTCNGATPRCQAYLTFISQPPYTSVSSISTLLAADPFPLSRLNSVPENATFETNNMVLVPVNCSCSGKYYQVNASYVAQQRDTVLIVANNTYQGLSTCQSLRAQNDNVTTENLYLGTRLRIPLRCACPTKNQSNDGVKYLLSYLVTGSQYVKLISDIFGADNSRTLEANSLSGDDTIFPFTTLLVPLERPPLSSQILPIPSPPPPPPTLPVSPSHNSTKTWIYVVAGGLGLLSVIGVVIFCIFFSRSKSPVGTLESSEALEKPDDKNLEEGFDFLHGVSSSAQSLKIYTFNEVNSATEGFSQSCRIKGSVYCGKINGDLAAIKKINGDVSKEINILNKINHFNIIRLSGVCFNDGCWFLVYEYAFNGPLSDWIYNNNISQKFLTWTQRIQIAFDIATGLNYLHCYASVHKDIKSSNILLDNNLRAKIANLSLVRSADRDGEHFVLTRHIVGTQGYMAPEYLENGIISPKLDVYSFGVLLIEMLTGKEVSSLYEVNTDLSDVLRPTLHEEDGEAFLSSFMDPSLKGNYPVNQAIFVIRLIDNCIKKDLSMRPEMHVIVQSLSKTISSSLPLEHTTILE